ncbi:putative odorant receptor 92a [Sabethes cyaneus]|uniref:putative odorant receptor 92a n=1 Tax=Sabethes cyaneus TaxID=53552 RepID=UPI00237E8EAB|nr:putative odorant receptor 92a [Sabethes cyaneus]
MAVPIKTEVLRAGLNYMRLIGLWGDKPRPVYRYFLFLAFEIAVMFLPKLAFGPGEEGFDSFACYLAELIFVGEIAVSIGLFNCRASSFEKLVTILMEVVERLDKKPTADGLRESVRDTEKFGRKYALYVWGVLATYFTIPLVTSVAAFLLKSDDERGEFARIMMMKFYWFDIRHNIVHYGLYWFLLYAACVCSAYQSVIKVTVIYTIIQYGAILFEFISVKIKHLDDFAEGNERRQELREIVQIHQMMLEYAVYLEKSVSFFLFNLISWCILMMCLMMYYVSTSFGPNALSVLVLIIYLLGEMGFFCFSGNKLSEKAAEVGNAMYDYAWYSEPVDMQKDMLLIIARSQRLTGITAAKFYIVDRERYGIVMQASYSYYLMLKSTF